LSTPAVFTAMNIDPFPEYLTIEQAAAYLSLRPAQVRKLLREFGLSEFTRAQIGKEVRISKHHLDIITGAHQETEEAPARPTRRRRGGAA
jgi:excisionase family DNA binding protein